MKRFNFPFDYKPKIDLKDTLKYSSVFKQLIMNHFYDKYHTIYVDPALLVTNKYSAGGHTKGDRLIAFDNKITNSITAINNSQENYLTLTSLLLKNQNILSYCPCIKRDAKQTNTSSVLSWNIKLDLAMPLENLNNDYFVQFTKSLFAELISLTKHESLRKIYKPLSSKIKANKYSVISLQKLENDYPTLSLKSAITHYVAKNNFAIILNNFKTTESNATLETPVVTAVDFDVCCGLYVYDDINDEAINIINVAKRPTGEKSFKQLNDTNPLEIENELYDKRLFSDNRPTNMSISINFTNLLFYLLDKVHLAEVVTSIWPDEFIEFVKKTNIEIF